MLSRTDSVYRDPASTIESRIREMRGHEIYKKAVTKARAMQRAGGTQERGSECPIRF